uniref:Fibrinogen C-terminal domain-containing protein n=1 Tax=Anopheles atroparvus TaxID=41427 RepID=A0A182JAR6_ANOAO
MDQTVWAVWINTKAGGVCWKTHRPVQKWVVWTARPTLATIELLMAKMDYLQGKLAEIELGIRQWQGVCLKSTLGSCQEESSRLSGKYLVQLGPNKRPFEVFCEQTSLGGGWTVIQQRFNGLENFYRNWTDYRDGFGNLGGEFWIGLERLNEMTSRRPHELMVEMKDFQGNYGYSNYKEFEIGSEVEQFRLKKLGVQSGTAGDALRVNQGQKFSTADRDNDANGNANCAVALKAGWWFFSCTNTNLNGPCNNTTDLGRYHPGAPTDDALLYSSLGYQQHLFKQLAHFQVLLSVLAARTNEPPV